MLTDEQRAQGWVEHDGKIKRLRPDPFADARMGLSLFQMQPEDWFVIEEMDLPEADSHD